MADAAIFDLTAETALTAAHEFVTQDTSAATRAQAATFALMGGLVYSASSADANVSATVGTLHAIDISGFTADRNFILPDSAQLGERIGVFLTVGDASFELDIVTAATGSLINGANAGGGTSWSRVFITNEVVILRCVKAGGAGDTDWIVEVDGRIPCSAVMEDVGGTSVANATTAQVLPDTSIWNVGGIVDTTNGEIRPRRSGRFSVYGFVRFDGMDDGENVSVVVGVDSVTTNRVSQNSMSSAAAAALLVAIAGFLDFVAATNTGFQLGAFQNSGVAKTPNTGAGARATLAATEILKR